MDKEVIEEGQDQGLSIKLASTKGGTEMWGFK